MQTEFKKWLVICYFWLIKRTRKVGSDQVYLLSAKLTAKYNIHFILHTNNLKISLIL